MNFIYMCDTCPCFCSCLCFEDIFDNYLCEGCDPYIYDYYDEGDDYDYKEGV